ncbi:MAG: 3-oxoacyl-ACP reductase FabG [Burkholderiales bacterium]
MDLEIAGRVAIVTGGGSGLGAETCRRLAAEGVHVAVADIDLASAEAVAAAILTAGGKALAVRADVINAASVTEMVDAAKQTFGAIHILVNNAGFQRDMHLTKMNEESWDAVVDVVLKGAYLCSRAVMPHLIEQRWGRVINMSSRAHLGNPGQANYSAAKAGLLGFTRALAMEEGRYNITVNAIAPGLIDTEAIQALPHYAKVREAAEKTTPIARIGHPRDVADAVLFLASERASYISGEVLHVTGGRY